jgi:hypothetical protein
MACDIAEERVRIVERQVPHLELEDAVARHDVERRPAALDADVRGRERHVVCVVVHARVPELARAPRGCTR